MDAIDVHEKEQVSDEPDQQDDEWDGDVNLKVMADDYAKYLVVHSKKDQASLHDRIDGIYTRVDEFKQQLYFLNQNITSNSEKMRELHENTEQLLALFQKIDVMEAFMTMVSSNVDQLEEAISLAENDLEPSKIRKVFSSFRFGKKNIPSKPEPSTNWNPPKVFRSKHYFPRKYTTASPSPSSSSTPPIGQAGEHIPIAQHEQTASAQGRVEEEADASS